MMSSALQGTTAQPLPRNLIVARDPIAGKVPLMKISVFGEAGARVIQQKKISLYLVVH